MNACFFFGRHKKQLRLTCTSDNLLLAHFYDRHYLIQIVYQMHAEKTLLMVLKNIFHRALLEVPI